MQVMTTKLRSGEFIPLPPEPWGRRLERARADVAHLSLEQAVAVAGRFMLTSDATISRLESLDVEPAGKRAASRRQLAFVLCLAYRVDPAEFGLSPDDLPPDVREAIIKAAGAAAITDPATPRYLLSLAA